MQEFITVVVIGLVLAGAYYLYKERKEKKRAGDDAPSDRDGPGTNLPR